MENRDVKIVVGLGNPGPKYENTFHNVGATVAKMLHDVGKFGSLPIEEFIVLDGFMNQSGLNLYKYLKNSKYELKNCLIIHDDSDLELGTYKISFAKSSAGQRGVQNIIDQFGSNEFWRLRVGIRKGDEEIRQKAGDFVLKKMSKEDKARVAKATLEAWREFFGLGA